MDIDDIIENHFKVEDFVNEIYVQRNNNKID